MITLRLNSKQKQSSAWKLGNDLFGKYASSTSNLSTDRKQLIKEKIRAKK